MKLYAQLNKPYTDRDRIDFIVKYNHAQGLEIKETETALEAWGYTEEEELKQLKETKKLEASKKAYEYIESGALFEFETPSLNPSPLEREIKTYHIEANDGNISKLGLAAVELVLNQDAESTIEWCTAEDETVNLNAEMLQKIVQGLKAEQTRIWTVLFPEFLKQIENAQTLEEVKSIEIDYTKAEKLINR